MPREYLRVPLMDRLRAKLERLPNGCLVWTGATDRKGYGKIGRGGRGEGTALVHRVVYEDHFGEVPVGKLVLHRCDNPPCCELTHLFVGTHADNVADMDAKGRRRTVALRGDRHWTRHHPERISRGAANPLAKLTAEQAAEIRVRYAEGEVSQTQLATAYGVSQPIVSRIVRGVAYGS
jgi:hypothetical protein